MEAVMQEKLEFRNFKGKGVAFVDLSDVERELLKELGAEVDEYRSVKDVPSDTKILVVGPFTSLKEEDLERLKELRAVVTRSTGCDHIPLDYCKRREINVCNIPDYGTNSVAEFTLLLILASLRKLKLINKKMNENINIDHRELEGSELTGKTVAVLGTGRIGSRVIELLQPFNVRVLAYSRTPKKHLIEKYGVKYTTLEDALKNSDIITIHLPLNEGTYHLLNEKTLKLVKPNTVIVNTARGSIIDTEALAKRLDILYVGLDVVEGENLRMKEMDILQGGYSREDLTNALLIEVFTKHPRVILTPHIAYNTKEANRRRLERTLFIINSLLKGEKLEEFLVV